MSDAQRAIRIMHADWQGDETLQDAIARLANTSPADVVVTHDGAVHDGRRWLSDDDLAALPDRLRTLGYSILPETSD